MPFLIKLNNLSLNQNLPDAFDVESIDGFTNQSFIVNIARAQMRHLPYYTLAVVPSEGNNEFLDGVSKYYASKQAGGQSEKVYYFVLPLFQFDAENICRETAEDALAFQSFDISLYPEEQQKALVDGTNYFLEEDSHLRLAQFTISQTILSNEIITKNERLTWLWCATFSKNPEIKAELMHECLKYHPTLRERARNILDELKNLPADHLSERTKELMKIAELGLRQRARRSNVN